MPTATVIPIVAAGSIGPTQLADPGTGKVWGSDGAGHAAAVLPPGHEFDYAQTTTPVTVNGSGVVIVAGNAVTYDGAAVMVEVYACSIQEDGVAADILRPLVTVDGTSVGFVGQYYSPASRIDVPLFARIRITPVAGSHTISFAGTITGGNFVVNAGAGGSGAFAPAYIRVTKV